MPGADVWSVNIENTKGICENEIKVLEQQIVINRPIHEEIKKLRSDQLLIGEKIRALERISVNREKWVRLMEELSSRLPEYTWLISIKEENSTPPVIHIEGRTFSFPEVANYMSQLKDSEYVNSVDLSK
jgi:Tfp pilus assembly protein PilN